MTDATSGRRAAPLSAAQALIRASTAVGDLYAECSAAAGLTVQQARLLFVLVQQPTNMLGLSTVLRVGKSTMTGVIGRMEATGLIERAPDPLDKRNLIVRPTDAGDIAARRFTEDLRTRVSALVEGRDDAELAVVARVLSDVIGRASSGGQ